MTKSPAKTRSPVKLHDRGLRQAGESAWRRVAVDGLGQAALGIGFGGGMLSAVVVVGLLLAFGTAVTLMFACLAITALIGAGYILWGLRRFRRELPYLQGAEGERAVGRVLDELRAHGWHVFHDVTLREGDDWNIDHVLVGPGGVFAVETKNWSKPTDEDTQLVWDGTTLFREIVKSGERVPDRHGAEAVAQARRNAKTLAQVLQNETVRQWRVGAAVVFPGWYVVRTAKMTGDVFVGNPTMLMWHLRKMTARLPAEHVALAKSMLELKCVR